MKLISDKKSRENQELRISFAPYFYDVTSVEVTGQVIPGIIENLNFIIKLCNQYHSLTDKITIRDPSELPIRFCEKKNSAYLSNLEFDLGQKNQREIDVGAYWSKILLKVTLFMLVHFLLCHCNYYSRINLL